MTIFGPSQFQLSDADFIPKRREISAITNALLPTVTTTEDHGYEVGQFVRLVVPDAYGMGLPYVKTQILTVPTDNTFTCDVDTSQLNSFLVPTYPPGFTTAHVVPITGQEVNQA